MSKRLLYLSISLVVILGAALQLSAGALSLMTKGENSVDSTSESGTRLDTVMIDFREMGLVNQQEVTDFESNGVSVIFSKGSGSVTPKYYSSGNAIRIYGGNTIKVNNTLEGSQLVEVRLQFGESDGSNEILLADGNAVIGGYISVSEGQSVDLTVGGKSGNRRIAAVMVIRRVTEDVPDDPAADEGTVSTVTIDFTQAPTEQTAEKLVWKVGNVTFTVTKEDSKYAIQDKEEYCNYCLTVYEGQKITISTTGGKAIKKATFQNCGLHPTFVPYSFSSLQNCSIDYIYRVATLTATDGVQTTIGGTVEGGLVNGIVGNPIFSGGHAQAVEIEIAGKGSDITPSDSIPGVTPSDSIPEITPSDSIPGVTPSDSIPGVTPSDSIPGVTPSDSIPGVTPSDSIPGVTPSDSIPGITPSDSIPGVTPSDSIPGINPSDSIPSVTPDSSEVDSKPFVLLYVDFLNYRSKVLRNPTALAMFDETEKYVDEHAVHFNSQEECDNLYAWLLGRFDAIRKMVGDKPYTGPEDDTSTADYANLNSAIRRSGWFIDDLKADSKYAEIQAELQNALDEAKKALDSKDQSVVDAAAQILEIALLKAQNDKKDMDKEPEIAEEEGTPMPPVAPDMSKYTHKMMVQGAPWGIEDLSIAILRDSEGRVVQKMTMQKDAEASSSHMTDSLRTYEYEGNKMIEYLSVPHYDQDDVLYLEPTMRTTTSYYKLASGHREIVEQAWYEDGDYVSSGKREEYVFDETGRKIRYKVYYRDNLDVDLTYTYDANGGCLGRGLYDGMENNFTYIRYDANGNLTGKTEWGTYYEYFYDSKNHYQGYKYYYDYNFDDNTYSRVHDENYFEIIEAYADGSAKTMRRKGDGQIRTFSREGNVETQTNSNSGSDVVITRTFDDQGRIAAKTSTENSFKSSFVYSDIESAKVLGGVNTFSEDVRINYNENVNWTTANPLAEASYERTFWGFDEGATTTYDIVPLSVLPAQNTDEGVALSLGKAGDQLVLGTDGEIYLLDKGGKKRYRVSIKDVKLSPDGYSISISSWIPVPSPSSAKGNRVARAAEQVDLSTNEFDIYIPENLFTINGKPLSRVFAPIETGKASEPNADVNGDSTIDTQDVLTIYDYMQNSTYDKAADVNGDGSVDTQDVLTTYDYMQTHAKERKEVVEE